MKLPALIFTVLSLSLFADESKPEVLQLWPDGKAPVAAGIHEKANSTLTVYRPAKPNGISVVICPGGGYARVVGAEGAPIAKWLNSHGITGLVLNYRLPKGNPQRPLTDVRRALRLTKAHCLKWNLDSSKVGVMGFSAGGHLAAMAATKFTPGNDQSKDKVEQQDSRPNFAILVYPVITMGEGTHAGSRQNLLGPKPNGDLIKLFSNERQVTTKTPPTFLAHAADDKPVPPLNSAMFHQALQAKNIETKYLELPSGGHGLNGYQGPMWEAWQKQSLEWLADLCKDSK